MSDELTQAPVIDLEAILQPISEETPSGESLRYAGIYDEITEARRADDDLNQGAWQTELKYADFRRVIDLAVPALTSKSKDLQIAVWLSEALTKQHGFAGLRDSLKLLTGLQEKFWETLHPEIDEGDMEGRANALSWFDTQGAYAAMGAPYTGGPGYGFFNYEDSKVFDFPENVESLGGDEQNRINTLKAQAEKERRVTAELWRSAIAATRRADVESANLVIEECFKEWSTLNAMVEEKFDRNQTPSLGGLKKALDQIQSEVKKLLEQKRAEEPDAADDEEVFGEEGVNEDGTPRPAGVATGAIANRRDALKRLNDIAEFFKKTEPHSPISYIVQRAVKWGEMPLDSWLQDVIKDESVLHSLRQTLGFNTGGDASNSQ